MSLKDKLSFIGSALQEKFQRNLYFDAKVRGRRIFLANYGIINTNLQTPIGFGIKILNVNILVLEQFGIAVNLYELTLLLYHCFIFSITKYFDSFFEHRVIEFPLPY